MKIRTISALVAVFGLSAISVYAQDDKPACRWQEEPTTVLIIGGNELPDKTEIKHTALEYYRATHPTGFQAEAMPRFLITDKKAKAVFTIGGFVNFRMGYDFNQVMPTLDFIPSSIPMSANVSNSQRFLMDGSTSRLFFRTVVKTKGGPLQAFISTDFRGAGNTFRLREAYISYFGFTLGQTVSTFTDLNASFNTIDFQGPNGYTYSRNLMVRYKYAWKNGLSVAVAAEYPVVSATYGSGSESIYQRVPDIPAYVQYNWSGGHIRASGILRNMFYLDKVANVDIDAIGWGAQLSGSANIGKIVTLYGDVVYGQGITPYIADLQGIGMDLRPNPAQGGHMATTQMMSWLLGAQVNVMPKLPITVGYSQVSIFNNNGVMGGNDYRLGQYVVANAFYNISRYWNVGVEYLYGTRSNFDGSFGNSHRIQAAVTFNF